MDKLNQIIEDSTPENWIDALPLYHKRNIENMLAAGSSYNDIAKIWVSAATATTAPFSSGTNPPENPGLLQSLLDETQAFICGDEKYAEEREKLVAYGVPARDSIVSAVALAIAQATGNLAAAAITPIVALALAMASKISVNAWCATRGQKT